MAKKTVVNLIDDLDGSEASQTLQFAFEGRHYVIDLNDTHAEEMRAALAPYTRAGRAPGIAPMRRRNNPTGTMDREAIRRWAKDNGLNVADRGRLPASVLEAYNNAHY